MNPAGIVMYSTSWCPDCRRARRVLESARVDYLDVDIERDPHAAKFVMQLNGGNRSVPTILFPDGTSLVEPGNEDLTRKLQTYAP